MTDIAARVCRYVNRQQLWQGAARVVAACSGGADSTALLLALHELHGQGAVALAGIAHLNHQLRPTADRDQEFCRALALRLGVPFIAQRADIDALRRIWRCSLEVAARRARYAFLEQARLECDAEHIAVAHTRDDQAETVLMRLIRGAGTRGLRGVLPVRGRVVRPVLECSRAELRDFLSSCGQPWMEDETNADLSHPRNRIRHELLPLLTERYRPSVAQVLARTADVAAEDDACLEDLASQARAALLTALDGAWRLDARALRALPVAVQRRVARQALTVAGAAGTPGLAGINRLLEVCSPGGSAAAQVSGVRVERFGADAVLLIRGEAPLVGAAAAEVPLPVPGVVAWPALGSGSRIVALGPIKRGDAAALGRFRVALAASKVVSPLRVRSRWAGDRIVPVGLGGTKTLQDLMVDRKVPRSQRHTVPLVLDGSGRIVWVVGLALAAHVAAGAEDDVIVLTFEQPASPGSEAS